MTLPKSRLGLLGIALATGALLVLAGNLVADLVLGHRPGGFGYIDAVDVAVGHFVDASLPLIVLALFGSRARLLWGTAILLSVLFWAYCIYQTWLDSLTGFEGGANIGLGLIMLASPFLILLVVGILSLVSGRKSPTS
jgi:hypothetical protein